MAETAIYMKKEGKKNEKDKFMRGLPKARKLDCGGHYL